MTGSISPLFQPMTLTPESKVRTGLAPLPFPSCDLDSRPETATVTVTLAAGGVGEEGGEEEGEDDGEDEEEDDGNDSDVSQLSDIDI